jgi:HEAT repeat protein
MALVGALLWTAPAAAQERTPSAIPVAAVSTETVAGWTARLTDAVPAERIRAAYALAELGKSAVPAVSALRTRLTDENPTVRYAAAWALSEIGEGARPAIGDLEDRAAHDEVGDVRWIAAKALRKLGVADARPGDGAATHPPIR